MVLLIDNYDSFSYNLYQYIGEMVSEIVVYRNDKITMADILQMNPESIIISPGPGRPENAGIIIDVIKRFNGVIPILGICLGHQAIGSALGGVIDFASEVVHGKQSMIQHDGSGIYQNLVKSFQVVRYHSLCLKEDQLPDCLLVQAYAEDGTIMGIRHKEYLTVGVQFHPESLLSEYGKEILENFFAMVEAQKGEKYE